MKVVRSTGVAVRAVPTDSDDVLCDYLETDVQYSVRIAANLLDTVQKVEQGELQTVTRSGNAYCVTIDTSGVKIESEYAIPPQVYATSLSAFKEALQAWIEALKEVSEAKSW